MFENGSILRHAVCGLAIVTVVVLSVAGVAMAVPGSAVWQRVSGERRLAGDGVSDSSGVVLCPCSISGPSTVCPSCTTEYSGPAGVISWAWSIASGDGAIVGPSDQQEVDVGAGANCSGSYRLRLTVHDTHGSNTCYKDIVIRDSEAPELDSPLPQDVTVECDAVPVAPILTASDDCGAVVTYDEQREDGGCPESYTLIRTWTAEDGCGNSDQHVQYIAVRDTTAPRFVGAPPCDIIVDCDAVPAAAQLTAADNCDASVVVTYSEVRTDGNCPFNYTLTRTWTATDDCGNSKQHIQRIMVFDTADPQFVGALPGDVTVECDAVPVAPTLTAEDDCDVIVPVTFDERRDDGGCPGTYALVRTWTATDGCGNSVQHVQHITVHDTQGPEFVETLLPQDVTVECDAVPVAPRLRAEDNCEGAVPVTFDEQRDDGGCPQSYTLVRTWTAEDWCGNSVQHVQYVTVHDTHAPWFREMPLPQDVTVECNAVPLAPTLTAEDNCDGAVPVMFDEQRDDGGCPQSYTLVRTWTAEDWCGNSVRHEQRITVRDTQAPEFVERPLPEDVDMECGGEVPVAPTLTAEDNCDGAVPVTFDEQRDDGGCPQSYTLVRTWTAEDECGNRVEHVQHVTVEDTMAPEFVEPLPEDVSAECGGEVPVAPVLTAVDACGGPVQVVFDEQREDGKCPGGYVLVRTWTAEDGCGNRVQHVQRVTAEDTTAPEFVEDLLPQDVTVECGEVPGAPVLTAEDNCEGSLPVMFEEGRLDGRCPGNYILVRTWTAVDGCGNSVHHEQNIAVLDTRAPGFVEAPLPEDLRVECGEVPGAPVLTARDNCEGAVKVKFSEQRNAGACPGSYTLVRTWTAVDWCGNKVEHVQHIAVEDATAPEFVETPLPEDMNLECGDEVPGAPVLTATDACEGPVQVAFDEERVGGPCPENYTLVRTWTAVDGCGNQVQHLQEVRVEDTIAPEFVETPLPQDATVECNAVPGAAVLTATDACDPEVQIGFTEQRRDGSCASTYALVRTWTATDNCGNVRTCSQTVNVVDTSAPVLGPVDDYRVLCSQPVVFTEPQVTSDNCGANPSVQVVQNTVTAGPGECEYTYTRCWEARDECGNVSNRVCQSIIRFEDYQPPVLTCAPDKEIEPGEPVLFDEPQVADNCLIPGLEPPNLTSTLSTAFADGETTYTRCWVAFDLCGNQSEECCQSITVTSPQEPPAYCTFVCWNWTAACLKDPYNHEISTPPACLRDEHFFDVFPGGVTIGSHATPGLFTARWTSPGAVERFKCGYGLPEPLKRDYVDPTRYDLGALQAEILTLRLNREFSCAGYFEDYGYPLGQGCFGEFVVPVEALRFSGLTVDQFLAIADRAVAGDKSVLLPYGNSYQRLYAVAQYLNWTFGECNGYGSEQSEPPLFSSGSRDGVTADNVPEEAQVPLPEAFSTAVEPNPLRTSVTMRMALPTGGDVSVDLYDIQGRKIVNLVRAHKSAGYHDVTWNGTDAFGSPVGPGVYFCRVQINGKPMAMEKLMKL